MTHLLCFGFGYTAKVFAGRLGKDARISGTSRQAQAFAGDLCPDHDAIVFDGTSPSDAVRLALTTATHLLASVPPVPDGDPVLLQHASDIAAAPHLRWIGYLSTVAVYGDAKSGLVDETTPARPASPRGRRRLDAEIAWLDLGQRSDKPVMIFRLPGIYGPGRSNFEEIRSGRARRIIKPGQVFNRVHVEDIASALAASMANITPGRVYNVTDDEPAAPQDVIDFAAGLLGVAAPPEIDFDTADLSEMARSFYGESKRVSNARMKAELNVRLAYPTYREGLKAVLEAERQLDFGRSSTR